MLRLIFFLIGLSSTSVLQAQNWFPTGASWYYNQIVGDQGEAYSFFEVIGDTIIQGKACKEINGGCSCGIPGVGSFIYEEEDKVFAYNNEADTFRLLYDFNLLPGDTLIFKGDPLGAGDGLFLIDSITFFQVDVLNLRVQHISELPPYFVTLGGNQIIERIGSNGCLFPQDGVCDPLTGGLRCYEDSETGLINFQNPERPCDYISTGTTEILDEPYMNVYPNPTTSAFHIDSKQTIEKIELFNSLSILSYQNLSVSNDHIEVDVGFLPPGFYFLKATTSDNNFIVKPVIIQ